MSIGAPQLVKAGDTNILKRRAYFDLRLASDATLPATSETGQPQIAVNNGAWTNTGIGTITEFGGTGLGNGRYYADLDQSVIASTDQFIRTRFKSGTTVETPGTYFYTVSEDPASDFVSLVTNSVVSALSGDIGVVVLPTTSQQLTLAQAVEVARSALRDQVQDSDRTQDIRESIRTLVSDFLNRTKVNTTESTFTATIGDPLLDLSSIAGFRSERFLRAQIDFKKPLESVDYQKVSRELDSSSENGEPNMIAFDTPTNAYVSPRPSTAASIKIKYSLAANSLANDSDTIQIPAEYVRPAIWWGVPALLRSAAQEGDEGDMGWRKYLDVVRSIGKPAESNKGIFKPNLADYN